LKGVMERAVVVVKQRMWGISQRTRRIEDLTLEGDNERSVAIVVKRRVGRTGRRTPLSMAAKFHGFIQM
jgi:hypothetical protein